MLRVTDRTRNFILYGGSALLLGGGALLYWAIPRFDAIPNYQRLALLLPLLTANAMLHIDDFRNWSSVHGIARGRAIGALLGPPMLLIGIAIWWLAAPGARA